MEQAELLARFKEWDEDCEFGCTCLGCDLLREAATDSDLIGQAQPHPKDCPCGECFYARRPNETRREYKLRTGVNP